LKDQLEAYIRKEPLLQGALIGISIRDAKTNEMLYDQLGDVRLRPASNMKLLTAAAAIEALGEGYSFKTEIRTDGKQKGHILHGNLYLIGKGDPTLLPVDFDTFAEKMKTQGITAIEGNVIGDDRWYDDVRLSTDMIWSDEQYHYGSQVSALTASADDDYDSGSVIIEVNPAAVGEAAKVTVHPETNYVTVVNEAVTGPNAAEEDIKITREHAGNIITVKGTIPAGAEELEERMSVWEPTGYALDLFRLSLKKYGITVHGGIHTGAVPHQTEMILDHSSIPLGKLLVPFMKLSNNGIGEILVKEMGKQAYGEGSWEKGLEVVAEVLPSLGMNIGTLTLKDGSGISHANLIPANEITSLLYTIQNKDWFSVYLNTLPKAGRKERMIGGTLHERMFDLSVQAKTGTINGVTTLSGYLQTNHGKKLIFSIMINNLLEDLEDEGKEIEDRLVEIITNYE
jgi:D-alanyl-D-alanine carboxypeptidase/D-alanyl-D-alanine-endopeptidase (penicillin-binding protein 4)